MINVIANGYKNINTGTEYSIIFDRPKLETTKEKTVKMSFKMKTPPPESTVRIIVEGRTYIEEKISSDEEYSLDFEFEPEFSVSFSRVELYNRDGRCIMLTNPIYVVDREEFRGDIPKERISEGI